MAGPRTMDGTILAHHGDLAHGPSRAISIVPRRRPFFKNMSVHDILLIAGETVLYNQAAGQVAMAPAGT